MIILCPKWDLNQGPSQMALFEDCKATAVTTQPPWLDLSERFTFFDDGGY